MESRERLSILIVVTDVIVKRWRTSAVQGARIWISGDLL